MNIGNDKRSRILKLDGLGKSLDEIARDTGLDAELVAHFLRKHGPGAVTKRGDPLDEEVVPPRKKSHSRTPVIKLLGWEQKDLEAFVENWQESPDYAVQAQAESLAEDQVRRVVVWLRAKGVKLARARGPRLDFEALKALVGGSA